MHADLIFAPGVKARFDKGIRCSALQNPIMRYCKFAAIIDRTTKSEELFVIFEPVANCALVFFHLSEGNGNITAVINQTLPVFFKNLLDISTFSENHKPRSVAVKTMDEVGATTQVATLEIFVENCLYAKAMM